MIATWSDHHFFDDDSYDKDEEVANLCIMTFEKPKVTSNTCDSHSYSFHELQDAFEESTIEFAIMNSKYKKMISKLNDEK